MIFKISVKLWTSNDYKKSRDFGFLIFLHFYQKYLYQISEYYWKTTYNQIKTKKRILERPQKWTLVIYCIFNTDYCLHKYSWLGTYLARGPLVPTENLPLLRYWGLCFSRGKQLSIYTGKCYKRANTSC